MKAKPHLTAARRKNLSQAIAAMRRPSNTFESLKDDAFLESLGNLAADQSVRQMAAINHHNDSTLAHSITVAHVSFHLARLFRLDAISTARGALLHDFFLYDWQHCPHPRHRTKHPGTALGNAMQRFTLNPKGHNTDPYVAGCPPVLLLQGILPRQFGRQDRFHKRHRHDPRFHLHPLLPENSGRLRIHPENIL